ncbi:uncharacterized protein LOC125829297 [Solanum verrucosum]|uniref:uncharacterized protein LOC125829297 n=1 Tax=Solanum verrucosum TaxID=315347 RepID=UPI0020D02AB6|nr:uncharacterized protein LOC125829297 [Solanum verrucosum]
MHVTDAEIVELVAYQLKGVTRIWFYQWKKNRAEGAPIMVADIRSSMSLFVSGLSRLSSKEGKAAMLIGDMDIARLTNHVQQVEEDKLRDREEFWNKNAKTSGMSVGGRRVIVGPQQSQRSIAQGGNGTPACAMCCRTHSGVCLDGSTGCFKCGKNGYFMKEFPKWGNTAQSSPVAPPDRVAPGGATSGASERSNNLSRSESIFVTLYVVMNFDVLPEKLLDPFSVSTHVEEMSVNGSNGSQVGHQDEFGNSTMSMSRILMTLI